MSDTAGKTRGDIAVVKVGMFRLPNFLQVNGTDIHMDIGELFPTDEAAKEFWEGCANDWICHVAERRARGAAQ